MARPFLLLIAPVLSVTLMTHRSPNPHSIQLLSRISAERHMRSCGMFECHTVGCPWQGATGNHPMTVPPHRADTSETCSVVRTHLTWRRVTKHIGSRVV